MYVHPYVFLHLAMWLGGFLYLAMLTGMVLCIHPNWLEDSPCDVIGWTLLPCDVICWQEWSWTAIQFDWRILEPCDVIGWTPIPCDVIGWTHIPCDVIGCTLIPCDVIAELLYLAMWFATLLYLAMWMGGLLYLAMWLAVLFYLAMGLGGLLYLAMWLVEANGAVPPTNWLEDFGTLQCDWVESYILRCVWLYSYTLRCDWLRRMVRYRRPPRCTPPETRPPPRTPRPASRLCSAQTIHPGTIKYCNQRRYFQTLKELRFQGISSKESIPRNQSKESIPRNQFRQPT